MFAVYKKPTDGPDQNPKLWFQDDPGSFWGYVQVPTKLFLRVDKLLEKLNIPMVGGRFATHSNKGVKAHQFLHWLAMFPLQIKRLWGPMCVPPVLGCFGVVPVTRLHFTTEHTSDMNYVSAITSNFQMHKGSLWLDQHVWWYPEAPVLKELAISCRDNPSPDSLTKWWFHIGFLSYMFYRLSDWKRV